MIVADSVSNIVNITEKIGCIITGNTMDGKGFAMRLRQEAAEYRFENGYDIPINSLASRAGNIAQLYTQHAYMRPLCATNILCGMDDEKGPQIFKIDPAGLVIGFKGAASGTKEAEAMNLMEKYYKKKSGNLSKEDTIYGAIMALQTVIGNDFKPTDIEVGFSSKEKPEFAKMKDAEIEVYLNKISEAD